MADDWVDVAPKEDWAPVAKPTDKTAKKPDEPMMSVPERFATGLKDPIEGGAQLLRHVLPGSVVRAGDKLNDALGLGPNPTDAEVKKRELSIQRTTPDPRETATTLDAQGRASHTPVSGRTPVDPVRMLGNAASPVNYTAARLGGPITSATLMGATTGATEPFTGKPGDFSREKVMQAGIGALTGAAMGSAGSAINPTFRKPVQEMLDAGVELTPGQLVGGVGRRAEEAGKSLPLTGTFIRGAEMRTVDSFNRATVNRALQPLGARVPDDLFGRDLIAYGQKALDDAYQAVVPHMKFDMRNDPQFAIDEANLHALTRNMPAPQVQQFDTLLQNRVVTRLAPTGTADGETMKQVDSELGFVASEYMRSQDPGQREYGRSVAELRNVIRDSLRRQNPNYAGFLNDVDSAYAMMVRVEGAASRRAIAGGRFTPGDLLASVKSEDKSVRHRRFARGDALLQGWGETAQEVIGNHMPDSGTAERRAFDILGTGGAAMTTPKVAIGLGIGSLPYTKPGQAAVNYLARPGPVRQAIGNAADVIAPLAAPSAATATSHAMSSPTTLEQLGGP